MCNVLLHKAAGSQTIDVFGVCVGFFVVVLVYGGVYVLFSFSKLYRSVSLH